MGRLFAHLFLLSGVSVLWTIPTEIQFYVIFVGLWWLFQKPPLLLFWLMALILVILFFAGFPRPVGRIKGVYIDISIISCLPYFLSGTLLGVVYSKWQVAKEQQSAWYLLVLIIIPLLFPNLFKHLFGHKNGLWRNVAVLFSVSFVFFSLLFLVPDDHWLLCNKLGDFLGQISYSLYLLHLPILLALSSYFQNGSFVLGGIFSYFVIFISLTLLSAYASFKFLENPSRTLLKSIKFS
jgi:peptidoglycan/LPS O-acetylase OafA/YrhL